MISVSKVGIEYIPVIRELAAITWAKAYADILLPGQLDYMLKLIYSEEALGRQMTDHQFLIAKDGETPLGFASYSLKEKTKPELYRLHKLYVLPDQQGKGIGKQLLNFILTEARSKGGNELELNVNRNNIAITFYKKNGFTILREEDIDIGQNYFMNDYVMSRPID